MRGPLRRSLTVLGLLALVALPARARPGSRWSFSPNRRPSRPREGRFRAARTSGATARLASSYRSRARGHTRSSFGPGAARRRRCGRRWRSLVDELEVKSVAVDRDRLADYRFETALTEGRHEVAAAFLNDGKSGQEDRNLYLERITIVGPSGAGAPRSVPSRESSEAAALRERSDRRGDRASDRQEPEIRRGRPRGRSHRSGRRGSQGDGDPDQARVPLRLQHLRLRPREGPGPERDLQDAVRGAVQLCDRRLLLALVRVRAREAPLSRDRPRGLLVPRARHPHERSPAPLGRRGRGTFLVDRPARTGDPARAGERDHGPLSRQDRLLRGGERALSSADPEDRRAVPMGPQPTPAPT